MCFKITESRVKICRQLNAFMYPNGLGCCGGYIVVNILFNVLPIVCGGSVFVLVLLLITLCPS